MAQTYSTRICGKYMEGYTSVWNAARGKLEADFLGEDETEDMFLDKIVGPRPSAEILVRARDESLPADEVRAMLTMPWAYERHEVSVDLWGLHREQGDSFFFKSALLVLGGPAVIVADVAVLNPALGLPSGNDTDLDLRWLAGNPLATFLVQDMHSSSRDHFRNHIIHAFARRLADSVMNVLAISRARKSTHRLLSDMRRRWQKWRETVGYMNGLDWSVLVAMATDSGHAKYALVPDIHPRGIVAVCLEQVGYMADDDGTIGLKACRNILDFVHAMEDKAGVPRTASPLPDLV